MSRKNRFPYLIDLGCVACRKNGFYHTPAEIHHLKGHNFSGMGMRAKDDDTIPLCYEHHRGKFGYHTSPRTFTLTYGTQQELLDYTNYLLRGSGYVPDSRHTKKY